MWSFRIAVGGAVLIAAMASASAQTAWTDPHADPLLVINQGPNVGRPPIVNDKPAPKTSAKTSKGVVTARSRLASLGNAVRPQAAATRSRAVSQGNAAVKQGSAWPSAYADAPNSMGKLPLALPPAVDPVADAPKESGHLVVGSRVAPVEQVRLLTDAPQLSVPIMVAEPEC
jgi:hypothetical protein